MDIIPHRRPKASSRDNQENPNQRRLDKQLSGQFAPFMSIIDSHNRKVSFDTGEELGDKVDKLVVMLGKLAIRDSGPGRQFKPQIHQSRGRGQK